MARNNMRWFRFYSQALEDPKVQKLPLELRWRWVEILCLANRNAERGHVPPVEDVAYALRLPVKKVQVIINALLERRLLDQNGTGTVAHNWDQWQFDSDNSTERVRKHRSNVSCNVTETLHETPPESEQTRLEQKQSQRQTKAERAASARSGGLVGTLIACYEKHIGPLTAGDCDELTDWADRMPSGSANADKDAVALAVYAFEQVPKDKNRTNWPYVRAILKDFESEGWRLDGPAEWSTE